MYAHGHCYIYFCGKKNVMESFMTIAWGGVSSQKRPPVYKSFRCTLVFLILDANKEVNRNVCVPCMFIGGIVVLEWLNRMCFFLVLKVTRLSVFLAIIQKNLFSHLKDQISAGRGFLFISFSVICRLPLCLFFL